jgi:sphingolipid delta-4 desaturase
LKLLAGYCPYTKYKIAATVALQLASAAAAARHGAAHPLAFLVLAWLWGGLLTSSLFLAAHEVSHNLAAASPRDNKLLGIFGALARARTDCRRVCGLLTRCRRTHRRRGTANLPVCIPFSISFGRYHRDHHSAQGTLGMDCDLPTQREAGWVASAGIAGKLAWLSAQLIFYALRPLLVRPKQPGTWEAINATIVLAFDAYLATSAAFGPRAIAYLLASVLLGGGLHPAGAHFIAEHYMWPLSAAEERVQTGKNADTLAEDAAAGRGASQETFSYYGRWNALTYDVGFHNEHHDLPSVPGCRLKQVRDAAPEFYSGLRSHSSYCAVIWAFVFDSRVGPFSRVTRAPLKAATE